MNTFKVTYLTIFFCVALSSLALGQRTDTLALDTFDEVEILGCFETEMIQGDKESITLEISDREIRRDDIKIKVTGGKLKVALRMEGIFRNGDCDRAKVKLKVYYKNFKELETGVGAEVSVSSLVRAHSLDLDVHTGSHLKINMEVKNLKISVNTGADVWISGQAEEQEASLNTGATLHAYDLDCKAVYIRSNTGASAKVRVSEYIEASAGTGGTISYKGNPQRQDIRTVLGGDVTQVSQ
jgi:Putative auto-transporter adhesin, head GIN domain